MRVSNLDVVEVLTASQMIQSQIRSYLLPLAQKQGEAKDFYESIVNEIIEDAQKIEREVMRAKEEIGQ